MSFKSLCFKNNSVTPTSSAASKYEVLNGITCISFFSSTITESSSDVSSVAPSAVEAAAESETETQASEVYRETEIQTDEETEKDETEFESETESQAAVATFGFSEEGDE